MPTKSKAERLSDVYEYLLSKLGKMPFGSYGGEIMSFRPLVALPILPDDIRKKHQQSFDDAIKGGKKALEIIKKELCNKDSPDAIEIIKAIAILAKHDYDLSMTRHVLLRSRQPSMDF